MQREMATGCGLSVALDTSGPNTSLQPTPLRGAAEFGR